MPIEIRELIIKATISGRESAEANTGTPASEGNEDMVSRCVDQVLQILAEKEER